MADLRPHTMHCASTHSRPKRFRLHTVHILQDATQSPNVNPECIQRPTADATLARLAQSAHPREIGSNKPYASGRGRHVGALVLWCLMTLSTIMASNATHQSTTHISKSAKDSHKLQRRTGVMTSGVGEREPLDVFVRRSFDDERPASEPQQLHQYYPQQNEPRQQQYDQNNNNNNLQQRHYQQQMWAQQQANAYAGAAPMSLQDAAFLTALTRREQQLASLPGNQAEWLAAANSIASLSSLLQNNAAQLEATSVNKDTTRQQSDSPEALTHIQQQQQQQQLQQQQQQQVQMMLRPDFASPYSRSMASDSASSRATGEQHNLAAAFAALNAASLSSNPSGFDTMMGLTPTNVVQLESSSMQQQPQQQQPSGSAANELQQSASTSAEHNAAPTTVSSGSRDARASAGFERPNANQNYGGLINTNTQDSQHEHASAQNSQTEPRSPDNQQADASAQQASAHQDQQQQQQQDAQQASASEKTIEPRSKRRIFNRILKKAEWNHLFVELSKVFLRYFLDLALKDIIGKQSGAASSGADSTTSRKKLDAQSEIADVFKDFVKTAISNI